MPGGSAPRVSCWPRRTWVASMSGAAIDVFPIEPKAQGDPFDSPLRGLDNVILTPHVGGSTQEAQEEIGHFVANKLLTFVTAGSTGLSVNLPQVVPPQP